MTIVDLEIWKERSLDPDLNFSTVVVDTNRGVLNNLQWNGFISIIHKRDAHYGRLFGSLKRTVKRMRWILVYEQACWALPADIWWHWGQIILLIISTSLLLILRSRVCNLGIASWGCYLVLFINLHPLCSDWYLSPIARRLPLRYESWWLAWVTSPGTEEFVAVVWRRWTTTGVPKMWFHMGIWFCSSPIYLGLQSKEHVTVES